MDGHPYGCSALQGSTYVLNVVVSSKYRRKGMGRLLMTAAADLARQEWASSQMCAHVSAQNNVRTFRCTVWHLCRMYCGSSTQHLLAHTQLTECNGFAGCHCAV